MAFKAHRVTTGLAWGGVLLLGLGLTSCIAPSFTYISDSGNNTYFKVPYGWRQISHTDLCAQLKSATSDTCSTVWLTAYEAGKPSAHDFGSSTLGKPFVFAEIGPYSSQTGTPLTDDTLRDFYLPVTAAARQAYQAATGQQLIGFKLLRDATLKLTGGVHGVRETFDYASANASDTFDEVVLANAAGTTVYAMLLHCTATCYSHDKSAINDVMSSFTVRS